MKIVKKILPDRRTEGIAIPTKEGPNDYQYFREYDNGWHISVVCNYAIRDYEQGYFEVAVWTNDKSSRYANHGVILLGTSLDFKEVADMLTGFEINPESEVTKNYIEIESGI